jgi:hypothetical protein
MMVLLMRCAMRVATRPRTVQAESVMPGPKGMSGVVSSAAMAARSRAVASMMESEASSSASW